jgi:hypothetical protein
MLKAADLSNELRPVFVADKWSTALHDELNIEMKLLGRPRIPNWEDDPGKVASSQVDFLEKKVRPIYVLLNSLTENRGKKLINKVESAIARHREMATS